MSCCPTWLTFIVIISDADNAEHAISILRLCCDCSNKDSISNDVLSSAKVFVIAGSQEMFTASEVHRRFVYILFQRGFGWSAVTQNCHR